MGNVLELIEEIREYGIKNDVRKCNEEPEMEIKKGEKCTEKFIRKKV